VHLFHAIKRNEHDRTVSSGDFWQVHAMLPPWNLSELEFKRVMKLYC